MREEAEEAEEIAAAIEALIRERYSQAPGSTVQSALQEVSGRIAKASRPLTAEEMCRRCEFYRDPSKWSAYGIGPEGAFLGWTRFDTQQEAEEYVRAQPEPWVLSPPRTPQ
jgi:hypothetical protein